MYCKSKEIHVNVLANKLSKSELDVVQVQVKCMQKTTCKSYHVYFT